MFGNSLKSPQNEQSQFNPRSAYGISKVAGFYLTKNYREAYNLFACSGILYNHESPRRNINFVTRKITKGLSLIIKGKKKKIKNGQLKFKERLGAYTRLCICNVENAPIKKTKRFCYWDWQNPYS